MQNTTKRELLSHNNKALQFLHGANGFDFTKPFYLEKIKGRFTHRQIMKLIKENIEGDFDASILLLKEENWSRSKRLYHVGLTPAKFYPAAKAGAWYKFDIDYFFSIGDFEETRKNRTDTVYIIAQKTEYRTRPARHPGIDPTMRYSVAPYGITKATDGRGTNWISKLELIPQTGNGEKFTYEPYRTFYPNDKRSDAITDYIDKSGYLIHPHRFDLKTRARKLKAEREKQAYLQTDYTARKNAIYNAIYTIQSKIADTALRANTAENAHKLYKITWEFDWLMRDVERMSKTDYASNADAQRAFAGIEEKIKELLTEENAPQEVAQ